MALSHHTPAHRTYSTPNLRFRALIDAIVATRLHAVDTITRDTRTVQLEESDALELYAAMSRVYRFDFGVDFDYHTTTR